MRNLFGLNRSVLWTAWDANTRYFRQPPKVRRRLRRAVKRSQNQQMEREVSLCLIDITAG